jgi:spindle assembly abnormal protein 6
MTTELLRNEPLFEKFVPVRIFDNQRDERVQHLVIRVLKGTKITATHRENLLHIEVTDEDEPFFLYTLDISEEEFHFLKQDQNLVVEFQNFAPMFIELLEHCVKHGSISSNSNNSNSNSDIDEEGRQDENSSAMEPSGSASSNANALKFTAQLDCRNTKQVTFDLIEANKFKNLTHLRLKLVCGTDTTIKGYLASRLEQVQQSNKRLLSRLEKTEMKLVAEENLAATLKQDLATIQHRFQNSQEDSERNNQTLVARKDSERQFELAKAREEFMKQNQELENNYKATVKDLQSKLTEALTKLPSLVQEKTRLATRNEELENIESDRLRQIENARQEVEGLRKRNRELDSSRFEVEKKTHKGEIQQAALQQQLQDKEDLLEQMSQRLEVAGQQRIGMEEALAMYKTQLEKVEAKFQASVNEINKGNEIIQRIHAEQRQLRSKAKVKGAIIAKQEEELSNKEKAIDVARAARRELESNLAKANDTIYRLENELERKGKNLDESNNLLQSNQQVIKWLNKEINEMQLQGTRSLGPTSAALGLGDLGRATDYLMPSKVGVGKMNHASPSATYQAFGNGANIAQEDDDADSSRLIAKLKSVAAPSDPLGEFKSVYVEQESFELLPKPSTAVPKQSSKPSAPIM